MGNRLLVTRDEISGRVARYDYDEFDNLISAEYERGGEVERLYRVPDRMGNLFETRERDDRRYDAGGRLAEDREHFYHYDCEGNLVFKEFKEMALRGGNVIAPINKERLETELGIRFRAFGTGWRYDWQSDGMLARVVRPDGKEVSFAYDALGRRIRKTYAGTTTHFVWDGNVPLHEWTEEAEENVVTWLFEQDTFVPAAKLVANGDCFSIVSDYLGTPMQAYDKQGNKVWEQELDIYGRQRKRPSAFIPFKYQGQYEDAETGLYYNRFRYYDPNAGSYISQDPIGLTGGNPTLYGYVGEPNSWIDVLGLSKIPAQTLQMKWETHVGSKHTQAHIHHGFPEKFSDRFKNIADIDVNNPKYHYNLPQNKHTKKPGVHTNSSRTGRNWNRTWSGILDRVEKMNLSKSEAKEFLEARLRELARKERISKYNSEAIKGAGKH